MAKIQLLDQNTINKIAAGEVVERPAAVVKELIENAIDAGANAVTCEIKEGGISLIRITDNGTGIERDQVDTAFLRHATSKIRTVEDLLSVHSLGFRGEALASIASVAQVELVTKTSKDMTGIRYIIEGGEKKSCDEIGCPNGTTFIVRNLFYNTPARRKFLKSPTTEASYINDLMMRLSVSHPDVSFKFIVNNQIKLHTSGNNNLKDILYSIYGREIATSLLPVQAEVEGIKLWGFIGKPIISRGNRSYENFYINGRYIKSGIICKAIEEAYKPYIMQHKYPFTAIHYEIDSDAIDVNVHPTKLEIRFRNGERVFKVTQEAISEALSTKEMIPEVSFTEKKEQKAKILEAPEPFERNRMEKQNSPFRLNRPNDVKSVVSSNNQNLNDKNEKNGNPYKVGMNELPEEVKKTEIGTLQNGNSEPKPDDTLSIFEQLKRKREALLARQEEEKATEQGKQMQETPVGTENTMEKASEANQENANIVEKEAVKSLNQESNASILSEQTDYGTGTQLNLFGTKVSDDETKEVVPAFLSQEARKNHRIVGQLFATYWIVEYDEKMFIIDQHAAHEKVLYEKTMKRIHEKRQMSQMIDPPIMITLSMREEEVLKKHQEVFECLGFEIEYFGGKEYSVRAVPSDMLNIADEMLLMDLIDSLVEDNYERDSNLVLEKVASMSCKAAIKGNMKISYQEASDLIDQLLELDNPYHCPHGRPVIISMSKYEIEKKFKRII